MKSHRVGWNPRVARDALKQTPWDRHTIQASRVKNHARLPRVRKSLYYGKFVAFQAWTRTPQISAASTAGCESASAIDEQVLPGKLKSTISQYWLQFWRSSFSFHIVMNNTFSVEGWYQIALRQLGPHSTQTWSPALNSSLVMLQKKNTCLFTPQQCHCFSDLMGAFPNPINCQWSLAILTKTQSGPVEAMRTRTL